MFSKEKADCPLWQAPCKQHQCRWWIQVQGHNPNTGEQINAWDCAINFIPLLLIENSQQQRQTGAAVEDFRNRMVAQNEVLKTLYGPPDDRGVLTDERKGRA